MRNASFSTVVVADPDPAAQRQIISLLQPEFRCLIANSLFEAFQLIQRERPVLVILELDQPDGDGILLIQRLQADPHLKMVLIACVTRRAGWKEKIRAFRAGADDYIVKPLPLVTFYGQILLLRRAGHLARSAVVR